MAGLNPKQKAAIFETLRKTGRMNPKVPSVPTPHPKMLAPIAPPTLPGAPNIPNANAVNPNFVGQGKSNRFKKIKSMFGL